MGEKLTLKLDTRDVQGKKVARLRKQGIIPAVVYGPGTDPINVQAPGNVLEKLYRQAGTYTPVHLSIGSKRKIAMIKDVDVEPVKGLIRHVSFHAVKASDPVNAEVPIHLVGEGESEAERNGLIVLQALEKVEVRALPMDLPDAIEVSVANLKEAGDKVTLADATLPEGVEYAEHDDGHHDDDEEKPRITDLMVASVWEPAALQAANESAAGDAEDESEVAADNGEDTPQGEQAEENTPGGKQQDEPKQSNVDANK